jgi:hypothetical protein
MHLGMSCCLAPQMCRVLHPSALRLLKEFCQFLFLQFLPFLQLQRRLDRLICKYLFIQNYRAYVVYNSYTIFMIIKRKVRLLAKNKKGRSYLEVSFKFTLLPRYIGFVPDSAGITYKLHIGIGHFLRLSVRMNTGASPGILYLRRRLAATANRGV